MLKKKAHNNGTDRLDILECLVLKIGECLEIFPTVEKFLEIRVSSHEIIFFISDLIVYKTT